MAYSVGWKASLDDKQYGSYFYTSGEDLKGDVVCSLRQAIESINLINPKKLTNFGFFLKPIDNEEEAKTAASKFLEIKG